MKLGLVILAAAGTVSIPLSHLREPTGFAKHQQLSADMRDFTTALHAYKQARGEYPVTLHALVDQRQLKRVPLDPWKREYIYRSPGLKHTHGFDVFSAGPDGVPDTADDDWGD